MDALRLLFEVERVPEKPFEFEDLDGVTWHGGGVAALGLAWAEGKPGRDGLWSGDDVLRVGAGVRATYGDSFGVRTDRGVARIDLTTTRPFKHDPKAGRAFLAGMAAMEFPRLEGTRRGSPVHSVWWTGTSTAAIKCRVYDKSRERGGDPFEAVRLEDQRRFPNGSRPFLEVAAASDFQRRHFLRRFEPMRKAVDGVKAATFPVVAQAIADEAKYGYRDWREAERLAGSLVLLMGGAGESYSRATMYRRRAELRDAGYVVVDDFLEPVEVDLGGELESALSEFSL